MSNVYKKEYDILVNAEQTIQDNLSKEELSQEFEVLTKKFKGLLRKTEKITRISDSLQFRLMEEQEKTDKLLLNTLPEKVVNDLKEYGKTWPESFDNVTVYFSDIAGFTKMSAQLEPKFLIDELNDIFTAFDDIIEKNNCERIKTIGDAYLAVCGMPEENEKHAENMVRASQQIMAYLEKRNKVNKWKWKIRIGIHTGSVVGGIVGVKKYIYDVFGDAVNTAARMESNSEPMRINVSESTYNLTKDNFQYTERESIDVKGKGQMKMFFVD